MSALPNRCFLFDPHGSRRYINAEERKVFLACAAREDAGVRTFAETLLCCGCHISEAFALTCSQINLDQHVIDFGTLKKSTVPAPPVLIEHLDLSHALRNRQVQAADR